MIKLPTHVLARGTVRAGGETEAAGNAAKLALVLLVHSITARSAQAGFSVVVVPSQATFCMKKLKLLRDFVISSERVQYE